jgi:ribosomal protein S15P/S13E
MEITIPHYVLWLIGTFGGGWLAWMIILTRMAFESKSDARSASEKDAVILSKITDVDKKIDDNKHDLNSKLDKIEARIERLFGAEFAFMKQNLVASQQGNRSV